MSRGLLALILVAYVLAIVGAVLTYRPGSLVYGATSWLGGCLFALLAQEGVRRGRQR